MNTEQFHAAICDIVKSEFANIDFNYNPMEWDNLPASMMNLALTVMQDAIDQSRDSCFAAPFHVSIGAFKDRKIHSHPDTVLDIEILPLDEDDACVRGSFNLADAILADADGSDKGWNVGHAIYQLEATIAKLRRESEQRGWDISYQPD